MRKRLFLAALLSCSFMAYSQANNDEAEMLGKWRIFASNDDVTAVLRAKDNSADMDLYCDKTHLELSVYLKKKPEEGELTSFTVSVDGHLLADTSWQSNIRTRSTTVKTSDLTLIKTLPAHQEIVFNYALQHKTKTEVAFDLTEIKPVIERANLVCKLDLSR